MWKLLKKWKRKKLLNKGSLLFLIEFLGGSFYTGSEMTSIIGSMVSCTKKASDYCLSNHFKKNFPRFCFVQKTETKTFKIQFQREKAVSKIGEILKALTIAAGDVAQW